MTAIDANDLYVQVQESAHSGSWRLWPLPRRLWSDIFLYTPMLPEWAPVPIPMRLLTPIFAQHYAKLTLNETENSLCHLQKIRGIAFHTQRDALPRNASK